MKKNILILSLFAGVLANLLVSCSNDDETINQDLLEGKWELSQIYVLDGDEYLKDEFSYPSKEWPTTQYCKLYITKITKSTQFEYEFLYNYGDLYKPYDMSDEDYENYVASGKCRALFNRKTVRRLQETKRFTCRLARLRLRCRGCKLVGKG